MTNKQIPLACDSSYESNNLQPPMFSAALLEFAAATGAATKNTILFLAFRKKQTIPFRSDLRAKIPITKELYGPYSPPTSITLNRLYICLPFVYPSIHPFQTNWFKSQFLQWRVKQGSDQGGAIEAFLRSISEKFHFGILPSSYQT